MMRQQLLGLRLRLLKVGKRLIELLDAAAGFSDARFGGMVDCRQLRRAGRQLRQRAFWLCCLALEPCHDRILGRHARFHLCNLRVAACSRSIVNWSARSASSSRRWRLNRMRFSARSSSNAACPIRF